MLTERFDEAFRYAHQLHRAQTRKGTPIPYISHLMAVAALVVEHGGTEDQAIAALLHDAAEDQGGAERLDEIRKKFGSTVAAIVSDCTDSWTEPKLRKLRKKAGLTQRQLAEKAGTSQQQIQRLEQEITLALAFHLCDALGETMDAVFPSAAKPISAVLKKIKKGDKDTHPITRIRTDEKATAELAAVGIDTDSSHLESKFIALEISARSLRGERLRRMRV